MYLHCSVVRLEIWSWYAIRRLVGVSEALKTDIFHRVGLFGAAQLKGHLEGASALVPSYLQPLLILWYHLMVCQPSVPTRVEC